MTHKYIQKEQLEELYVLKKKTMKEIGKILNCSASKIYNSLNEYNIKTRKRGHDIPWNKGLTASDGRVSEYTKKRIITIKKMYRDGIIKPWNKGLTVYTDERVRKMNEKLSSIRKNIFKGPGNPFYNKKHKEEWKKEQSLRKGGTGIPYELNNYGEKFTEELKETIRNRDNRRCQLCDLEEKNCNVKLHVHHINYEKKNCSKINLISLCPSCHTATNTNREYWKGLLTDKVRKRVLV